MHRGCRRPRHASHASSCATIHKSIVASTVISVVSVSITVASRVATVRDRDRGAGTATFGSLRGDIFFERAYPRRKSIGFLEAGGRRRQHGTATGSCAYLF